MMVKELNSSTDLQFEQNMVRKDNELMVQDQERRSWRKVNMAATLKDTLVKQ